MEMDEENPQMIEVAINGEKKQAPAGLTVAGLLENLNVKKATVVVEHNRVVLKQSELDEVAVKAGDELEIVRFVGGG